MNENRKDLIQYRLERALETFEDAQILSEKEKWNSTINRLYYSAFYAVTAFLLTCELTLSTHSGVKSNFTEHFIKTGRIEKHYGKMYSQLFSWRQKRDYGDLFHFNQQMVSPYMEPV
ncbi:MAG: hypothetical protein ACJA2S_003855 [Cyclobacteriaceae bacterium]|jgi:uncharacterized protein (UPF0332 family)